MTAQPGRGHNPPLPIVLVDDEAHALRSYRMQLLSAGFDNLVSFARGEEALAFLMEHEAALVLLDLVMPGLSGEELLGMLARECPAVPVVIVTATSAVETAVLCMKKGACDFLVKPLDGNTVLATVRQALEMGELRRENTLLNRSYLSRSETRPELFRDIVTRDERMHAIFRYLESIAASSQPVLIAGESGTGKELIARVLHTASGRNGDFVAVNIAGLDAMAFSDTLFGHRRGAFTGAEGSRDGLVARAAGGTLFLDEIGDLAPDMQVKLLRLLQEREYFPLGADAPRITDARVLVATNRPPDRLLAEGRLRPDLYYRLRIHCVDLPPLRERRGDIPLLVRHILRQASSESRRPEPVLAPAVLDWLQRQPFPGNIRELQALVCDALHRQPEGLTLGPEAFGMATCEPAVTFAAEAPAPGPQPAVIPTLAEAEKRLVAQALEATAGNLTAAARLLGISRQTLHRKVKPDPA